MGDHPDCRARLHNWWNAPRTLAKVKEIDPVASHASWMENFPWTRLCDVALPRERKPSVDLGLLHSLPPREARDYLGDGNFAGLYERPDAEMLAMWQVGVEETRAAIEGPWTVPNA